MDKQAIIEWLDSRTYTKKFLVPTMAAWFVNQAGEADGESEWQKFERTNGAFRCGECGGPTEIAQCRVCDGEGIRPDPDDRENTLDCLHCDGEGVVTRCAIDCKKTLAHMRRQESKRLEAWNSGQAIRIGV